jgi:predicted N-acetyltransferase YhbS
MAERDSSIRPLSGLSISIPAPEEDREILELLSATFGEARSLEDWRWRYRTGDGRSGLSLIVRDDKTGQVVGHVGASPATAHAWGVAISTAQIHDAMTRPGWEGRGIFLSAFEAMSKRLREQGCVFVYSVPNRRSLPIFIRHFDWSRLFDTRQWRCRLSLVEPIERISRSRTLAHAVNLPFLFASTLGRQISIFMMGLQRKGQAFEVCAGMPGGVDEFWRTRCHEENIVFSRDPDWLRWRLDSRPGRPYEYYCLRKQGVLHAVAVGLRQGSVLRLIDLQVAGPDPVLARLLVFRIAAHARKTGTRDLQIAGRHEFLLDEALKDFASTGHNPHVFCVGMLSASPFHRELLQPGNWSMFEIDTDAV